MGNEDKINEAISKSKLGRVGMTKKSLYAILSVLACVVLIFAVSIAHVGFNKEFYKDVNYWINLALLAGLSIFGMFTGEQIGDDISRNNPNGRFRKSLSKYSQKHKQIDDKKLFSFFEDWLDDYRDRKLKNKIKDVLKDHGILQLEVLDLDQLELENLKNGWRKTWDGTDKFDKYYNPKTGESVTYFLSYTEEQIEIIRFCLRGKVKVSKLPSSFFTDALNAYEKDMWESSAHAHQKKNAYLSINTTYKLIGLVAFSFVISGLQPSAQDGITFAEVMVSLGSKLFTLITSLVWGLYIGMEMVKIDTSYLDYKISVLSLYEEEIDLKLFIPKTIEEKAKEAYFNNNNLMIEHKKHTEIHIGGDENDREIKE